MLRTTCVLPIACFHEFALCCRRPGIRDARAERHLRGWRSGARALAQAHGHHAPARSARHTRGLADRQVYRPLLHFCSGFSPLSSAPRALSLQTDSIFVFPCCSPEYTTVVGVHPKSFLYSYAYSFTGEVAPHGPDSQTTQFIFSRNRVLIIKFAIAIRRRRDLISFFPYYAKEDSC